MNNFGTRRPLLRMLFTLVVTAATLWLVSLVMTTVTVPDAGDAFIAAALIGLINALVWPLLIRVALPFTVLTLGLGVLVLNGLVVLAVSGLDVGFEVNGLGPAIVVAIAITLANTLVTTLLAIDDDDFYYRNVVKRQAQRAKGAQRTEVPGLFFLEIDGLAHEVVVRAIRDGNMPNLARWLRDGSHRLARWETDWSSQTGACQAGLLHGDNDDMPAFRWWEKDRNTAIVTNHPKDAVELERRHSNGRGLLFEDGCSRANILSGDAVHSLLTMSTVLDTKRPGRIGQDYFAYFANPYNVTRTFINFVSEFVRERWAAKQQVRMDVQPRIKRSFGYGFARAWATVLQLDLQVQAVIADLYAGRPVCYTTFLAYDEVAHHSGVERSDTLATLRKVDRQLARIAGAAENAPRPYRFVVLADHGQSQGATFLDRYGVSLEEIVKQACDVDSVDAQQQGSETAGYVGASLTEASEGEGPRARIVRRLTRSRSVDGQVLVGNEAEREGEKEEDELPELSVMASGCLGLVSFPRLPGRLTREQIDEHYPRLIAALRDHPGIGFLLVRSRQDGAVVIGKGGTNYLDRQRIEGDDPLAPFGPNATRHAVRTDSFPHCPDIVLNSTYWSDMDEVAAFEELVGSHGGMGGAQSFPFVVFPNDFAMPEEDLVGAEAVHRQFRRWLVDLGHDGYADGAGSGSSPDPVASRSRLRSASPTNG